MSNQGSGTSLYYQKSGVDLQLNAIKSETDDITISLDAGTHDVEVEFNPGSVAATELSDGANVAHTNAAETLAGNWVNTANPWADNEVSDTLTASVLSGSLGAALNISNQIIYDAFNTITGADPDVSGGTFFKTNNVGATTIADFDAGGGALQDGEVIFVLIDDVNTDVDFTASGLKGHNGVDWDPSENDSMLCVYDGTDWNCIVSRPSSLTVSEFTFPNSDNPTTDATGKCAYDNNADALECHDGTNSRLIATTTKCETYSILEPDQVQAVTDDVVIKSVMVEAYPHGLTMTDNAISCSGNVTDTFLIEEWSNRAGAAQSTIESITLTATNYQEDDGTLSDADIASDAFINVNLDDSSDNVAECEVTLCFEVNEGN
jgi:hypothetical protein